ncbi:MAG: cytochrome c3 family protein [Pseudomonadota bacterium]
MKIGRNVKTALSSVLFCAFALTFPAKGIAQERENSCITCHKDLGDESRAQVEQWEKSIHREAGIGCADCHGGDPGSMDMDAAKSEKAGFIGKPDARGVPALCAECHSDIARMRQYNIRTDQYAEYKTSIHGRMLLEKGDTKVATCVSCHGNHEIRKKDDPLSSVYHTRVPETCGKCHSDPERMKPYNIPTDQVEEYKASYHGQILYAEIKGKNPALVPNCADCHGIHGATPPGVREVANVCGNCHFNNAQYFRESPHYQAVQDAGIPRCVDCHGNHNISYPTLEKFTGDKEGHCGYCHEPSSPAYALALEIKQLLEDSSGAIERAKKKSGEVEFSGINLEFINAEIETAQDKLIEVLPVTHSLKMDKIKRLMKEAGEHTDRVIAEVGKIQEDLKRRKRALMVVIGVDFMIVGLLYAKKRSFSKRPR